MSLYPALGFGIVKIFFLPAAPIYNSALKGFRDQPTDFIALERHKFFLRIIFVKLRTKIYGVNSWIISFHNEEVLRSKPNIVFLCNFSFLRRSGNTKSFRRGTNNCPRLQQDDPVLTCGVIRMDPD